MITTFSIHKKQIIWHKMLPLSASIEDMWKTSKSNIRIRVYIIPFSSLTNFIQCRFTETEAQFFFVFGYMHTCINYNA